MTYQQQHSKIVRVEVSVGNDDDARTIENFVEAIKAALKKSPAKAKTITVQGTYYIIDGKVCLPADYNPETKDRNPGTHPPAWAGGPQPSNVRRTISQAEDDAPREFVHVKPTRSNVRDPRTGRRVRSDKGVPRGPRKQTEAS